jgi:hypothetical protein
VPGVTIYFSDFKRSLVDKLQKVRSYFGYCTSSSSSSSSRRLCCFCVPTVALLELMYSSNVPYVVMPELQS